MNARHRRKSMTRLVYLLGAALAAGVLATPAVAQAPGNNPFPGKKVDVFLYVDTVNGSRPKGAPARPVSCTQTSYYKRGEQLVFRVWGNETATGDVLSTENVRYAYVKIPGQPNVKFNWGAHGTAPNRVWFWTAAFDIPADYPLGVMAYRVVFKTETGKFGIFDPSKLPEPSRLNINP
jgi:hypothetical protein